MKLSIGTEEKAIVIAGQSGGVWKPNPNLMTELEAFLKGADPEQFEMWVEEDE
jgi:hypothetical protein